MMAGIRYVQMDDKAFWYSLDNHLPESEYANKVYNKQGYILTEGIIFFGTILHFVIC